jgi:cysteine-rich repeat protein
MSSGEQCDDGDNDGGYGECANGCKLGARCGDGKVQGDDGEECDDGNSENGDLCSTACKKSVVK